MITVRNVGLYYWLKKSMLRRRRFWAIEDISFTVQPGDCYGIIGRNGAGKTTMLRLLGGIIKPDRGRIDHNGLNVQLLSLQAGMVPYLTGRENAILNGMLLGFSKAEVMERMDDIVEFSELGDFMDQPFRMYSTGMRARLGFSVAFQMDPDVLLIDEVFGVGDVSFRQKSSAVIKEKIASGKTVILVSHSTGLIRGFCNRAVWIEKGATRHEGETSEVIREYEAFIETLKQRQPSLSIGDDKAEG